MFTVTAVWAFGLTVAILALDHQQATSPSGDGCGENCGPFYCQARCVSSCLDTGVGTNIEECTRDFCMEFDENTPCRANDKECWKTCGFEASPEDKPAPSEVPDLQEDYHKDGFSTSANNPYTIGLKWSPKWDSTLYIVEVFPKFIVDDHSGTSQPVIRNLTTSTSYLFPRDLCTVYTVRVSAVNAFGVSQPKTVVFNAWAPELHYDENFDVQSIRREGDNVNVVIKYTPPEVWRPEDVQLDTSTVLASKCQGPLNESIFLSSQPQDGGFYTPLVFINETDTNIILSFPSQIMDSQCMFSYRVTSLRTGCNGTTVTIDPKTVDAAGADFGINCQSVENSGCAQSGEIINMPMEGNKTADDNVVVVIDPDVIPDNMTTLAPKRPILGEDLENSSEEEPFEPTTPSTIPMSNSGEEKSISGEEKSASREQPQSGEKPINSGGVSSSGGKSRSGERPLVVGAPISGGKSNSGGKSISREKADSGEDMSAELNVVDEMTTPKSLPDSNGILDWFGSSEESKEAKQVPPPSDSIDQESMNGPVDMELPAIVIVEPRDPNAPMCALAEFNAEIDSKGIIDSEEQQTVDLVLSWTEERIPFVNVPTPKYFLIRYGSVERTVVVDPRPEFFAEDIVRTPSPADSTEDIPRAFKISGLQRDGLYAFQVCAIYAPDPDLETMWDSAEQYLVDLSASDADDMIETKHALPVGPPPHEPQEEIDKLKPSGNSSDWDIMDFFFDVMNSSMDAVQEIVNGTEDGKKPPSDYFYNDLAIIDGDEDVNMQQQQQRPRGMSSSSASDEVFSPKSASDEMTDDTDDIAVLELVPAEPSVVNVEVQPVVVEQDKSSMSSMRAFWFITIVALLVITISGIFLFVFKRNRRMRYNNKQQQFVLPPPNPGPETKIPLP